MVASPVVFATSQAVSRSRSAGWRPSPTVTARMIPTISAGVVVSRSSAGPAETLSAGSVRSKRVVASPRPRTNAVTAAGPPRRSRSRFAAVLSLTVTAASHRSVTVMPVATFCVVTGAYSSSTSGP
jgi:hypothetical protein